MMGAAATRLRCTEGQAYTLALGLVLATLLSLAGPGGLPAPLAAAPTPLVPAAAAPAATGTGSGAAPVAPAASRPTSVGASLGSGQAAAPVADDPPLAPGAPAAAGPTAGETTALTVRSSTWASALAGTPLDIDSIGEDSLPVANRFGRVDKASFVRLAGAEEVLHLVEDQGAARELIGPAQVALCPIREPGWEEERSGQALAQAPAWDAAACVMGVEVAPGSWSFDLSGFADPTGDAGFALVPGPAAPFDFQVAFER